MSETNITARKVRKRVTIQTILDALEAGPMTAPKLAEEVEISKSHTRDLLRELLEDDKVERVREAECRTAALYALPDTDDGSDR